MAENELTLKEVNDLFSYISKMDKLAAQEPDRNDRKTWESWNAEITALLEKYKDVVSKTLSASISDWTDNPRDATDVLKYYVATNSRFNLQMFAGDPEDQQVIEELETKRQLFSHSVYGLPNDLLDKKMLSEKPQLIEINGKPAVQWRVNQAGDKKPPVISRVALMPKGSDDTSVITDNIIDGYDQAITTAIGNLIYAQEIRGFFGPWDFTTDDIWREMNGLTGTRKTPTSNQGQEISTRIDKMCFTKTWVDVSNEIRAGYIDVAKLRLKDSGPIKDNYIHAVQRPMKTIKGRSVSCYRFYDYPIRYRINKVKGHLIYTDYARLDTSDETGYTKEVIVIRNYLQREIERMYSGDRPQKRILYKTLYKDNAMQTPEEYADEHEHKTENAYKTTVSKKFSADRKIVKGILRSWAKKENGQWIKGFEEFKDGHKYAGIEIKLNPKYSKRPAGK